MNEYEKNLKHIKNNQTIYHAIDRYSNQASKYETNFVTLSVFNNIKSSLQQLYDRLETL